MYFRLVAEVEATYGAFFGKAGLLIQAGVKRGRETIPQDPHGDRPYWALIGANGPDASPRLRGPTK